MTRRSWPERKNLRGLFLYAFLAARVARLFARQPQRGETIRPQRVPRHFRGGLIRVPRVFLGGLQCGRGRLLIALAGLLGVGGRQIMAGCLE